MEGLITLSAKEWDRAKVIQRVAEGGGAQAEAFGREPSPCSAFASALSGRGGGGVGISKARLSIKPQDCGLGSRAGLGLGADALCGFRPDARA